MSDKQVFTPTIHILLNSDEVAAYTFQEIKAQIQSKPTSVLTLPTGGTPLEIYRLLAKSRSEDGLDFSQLTTLNLDEYWPIRHDHPSSYAFYMDENLFSKVNIPFENRNIPNGEAEDVDVEAERYEALLQKYQIDLGLITLGPGETCHIGFNEKGSAADSIVRYTPLDDQTKEANLRFFDRPEDMPRGAITQGVADILRAERILFVATGEHKAWGVRRSLEGEIHSDAPASFLRYHPNVTVVLDQAAASLLEQSS